MFYLAHRHKEAPPSRGKWQQCSVKVQVRERDRENKYRKTVEVRWREKSNGDQS